MKKNNMFKIFAITMVLILTMSFTVMAEPFDTQYTAATEEENVSLENTELSLLSSQTVKKPAAVKKIAVKKTSKGIKVSWSKTKRADKYKLYKKVKGGKWKLIKTTTKTKCTVKKVKDGKKYCFKVKAVNKKGYTVSAHVWIKYVNHKWSDYKVTVPSTCTVKGTKIKTCKICGKTHTEKCKKLKAHSYVKDEERSYAATCTTDGLNVSACSVCGDEKTEIISAAHTPSEAVRENVVHSTCTEKGSYDLVTKCSVCGETLSTEHKETDARGHSYDEPEWNWSEDGTSAEAVFTCSVCGEKKTVNAAVTASDSTATCTEAGSITYTAAAKLDEKTYKSTKKVEVEALGHELSEYTTQKFTTVCYDCNKIPLYTSNFSIHNFTLHLGYEMSVENKAGHYGDTYVDVIHEKCNRKGCEYDAVKYAEYNGVKTYPDEELLVY